MLIDAVRTDRPNWTPKKAAKWLTRELPGIRTALRFRARDYIKELLLQESLAEDLEG